MRHLLTVTAFFTIVAVFAACGEDSKPAPLATGTVAQSTATPSVSTPTPSPTAAPSPTAIPQPQPSAEVVWTFFSPSERLFRGLAILKNPGSRAINGVQMRWDAADKDGVLVGSFPSRQPDIPPGGTVYYAFGAGSASLSGQPASVKLVITNGGSFADKASPALVVSSPAFAPASFPSFFKAPNNYSVSAVVAIGDSSVAVANINVVAILKDASGAVVGAGFVSPPMLPDPVPAGTKIKYEDNSVAATGVAASVEFFAAVRP